VPRTALVAVVVIATLGLPQAGSSPGVHLDSSLVPGSCSACHRGHGVSDSPMLPAPQKQVCLSCHGSEAKSSEAVARGLLSPTARPRPVASALSQPFVHPVDDHAFSRREAGVVTCSSCHSPHRGSVRQLSGDRAAASRSTLDPGDAQFELCGSCHTGNGKAARDPGDIDGLLNPRNESFHPVKSPARGASPSLRSALAGSEMSCSNCHGSDDASRDTGPHGSSVAFILRASYSTLDGVDESQQTYRLCYGCHDREAVLGSQDFPEHRRHVVDLKTSCATCHNPHGSYASRALIRFEDDATLASVAPSMQANRIAFKSTGPGSGLCYLTCHGFDHAPAGYGTAAALQDDPVESSAGSRRSTTTRQPRQSDRRPRDRRR